MRTLFPRASRIAAVRSALAVLLVGLASAAMAQVPAVDWKAEWAEILRHYRALVQIDTSNPPGNETLAANYLKGVFEAAGIPVKTFALEPARANLVARIKGNGSKRPVLIMAHTDVVGVQREKWPVDPFGAVAKDGYIWGRGTKDDKDKLPPISSRCCLRRSSTFLSTATSSSWPRRARKAPRPWASISW